MSRAVAARAADPWHAPDRDAHSESGSGIKSRIRFFRDWPGKGAPAWFCDGGDGPEQNLASGSNDPWMTPDPHGFVIRSIDSVPGAIGHPRPKVRLENLVSNRPRNQ